ncbi:tetratricopeptide repeat protein, partial [Streptomyces sp. NPDC101776]|uniref:tetratricopeptide repeat protein n=1 Tax=Streptomyces sp. NPDC101776 TaxID=3366146 RepID=UPI0037F22C61
DHPDTLTARNNLANSYSHAGRLQEALDLREQVLADRERILGPDHPATLTARNNLANSYDDVATAGEQPNTATPPTTPALPPSSAPPAQPQ